jgi:hypothetical protein
MPETQRQVFVVGMVDGGVTVSTGSIAAWEACRGVGTRNRLQN